MGSKRRLKTEGTECAVDKGLEKRLYKAALTQTVDAMNRNAEKKDGERRKQRDYSAKKQNRNAKVKERQKTTKPTAFMKPLGGLKARPATAIRASEEAGPEDSSIAEEPKGPSRKERRQMKIESRGAGISSKEYYEKNVKKNKDRVVHNRDVIPSRTKKDFPVKQKAQDQGKKPKHSRRGQFH
jgi:hypothetical protein